MNNKHYQKAFRFVRQCRDGFVRRSEGNHVKRFFNRLRLIGNHFSYGNFVSDCRRYMGLELLWCLI